MFSKAKLAGVGPRQWIALSCCLVAVAPAQAFTALSNGPSSDAWSAWVSPHAILLVVLLSTLAVSLGWAHALRREVRRRRAAEAQLIKARDQAERLAWTRQDILVVAAHEVRAPVHAITAAINRLSQLVRDPAQRELVRITRRSADALAEFVNNVLDLSKDEAGKLTLNSRPDDLAALVQDVVESFLPSAAERGNTLTYQKHGPVPACLRFDAMRVRQIVTNLVSNAIKFTAGGRIAVVLTAQTVGIGERSCATWITVSDEGIGITPEQQRRLFEPYAQFATGAAARFGGIGLGLPICKRLAEAMGGSIDLQSEWEKGTSARVKLTLGTCDPVDALEASRQRKRPRVLIAHADRVQQIVLTTTLRQIGIDPDVADDAGQALAHWREQRHDLVLADCNLPGTDGSSLARQLIEEGGQEVRVIGVGADPHDAVQAVAAGMSTFLQKPVSAAQLQHAIAAAMAQQRCTIPEKAE